LLMYRPYILPLSTTLDNIVKKSRKQKRPNGAI
jgi:hypothetical protein